MDFGKYFIFFRGACFTSPPAPLQRRGVQERESIVEIKLGISLFTLKDTLFTLAYALFSLEDALFTLEGGLFTLAGDPS